MSQGNIITSHSSLEEYEPIGKKLGKYKNNANYNIYRHLSDIN